MLLFFFLLYSESYYLRNFDGNPSKRSQHYAAHLFADMVTFAANHCQKLEMLVSQQKNVDFETHLQNFLLMHV